MADDQENKNGEQKPEENAVSITERIVPTPAELELAGKKINAIQLEASKLTADLKEKIDNISAECEKNFSEIKESSAKFVKDIQADKDKIQAILNEANLNVKNINDHRESIIKVNAQMETLNNSASSSFEKIKGLGATSDVVEANIKKYQTTLESMNTEYNKYVENIQSLLPGATSAGLAFAFEERKTSYNTSIKVWTVLRFIAILLFLLWGWYVYQEIAPVLEKMQNTDFSVSIRTWTSWFFNKTPIIVGLILFEEFSRRTYNKYFKLEEDYAHKQILSQSFEGYKNELPKLRENQKANTALDKLCENTIQAISETPLRLIKEEREAGSRSIFDWFAGRRKEEKPSPN